MFEIVLAICGVADCWYATVSIYGMYSDLYRRNHAYLGVPYTVNEDNMGLKACTLLNT